MRIPSPPSTPRHHLGGYAELAPPAHLLGYVDCLWAYRAGTGLPGSSHRVLPSAGTSLCFQYLKGGDGIVAPELFVIGPVRSPRLFAPDPGLVMEAVQLEPAWCGAILGIDPTDHVDGFAPWASLHPVGGPGLLDRVVREAVRGRSTLPVLLGHIEERIARAAADAGALLTARAMDRLRGRGRAGPERVASVAEALDVTPRHLRRVVRAVTGVSPKYLHRVHRLMRLVTDADRRPAPRWASLAVAHGFYDQAHLIQECRALTGCTPRALHHERRDEDVRFFQSPPAPVR